MARADKIRINKYKSEYIIILVEVYTRQKWHLMADSIGTKLGNINGEHFKMNYINAKHLFQLYDAETYHCAVQHNSTSPYDATINHSNT